MAHGQDVAARKRLLAQAAVFFFEGKPEALEHFLNTGSLDTRKAALPCSTAFLEGMQRTADRRKQRNK